MINVASWFMVCLFIFLFNCHSKASYVLGFIIKLDFSVDRKQHYSIRHFEFRLWPLSSVSTHTTWSFKLSPSVFQVSRGSSDTPRSLSGQKNTHTKTKKAMITKNVIFLSLFTNSRLESYLNYHSLESSSFPHVSTSLGGGRWMVASFPLTRPTTFWPYFGSLPRYKGLGRRDKGQRSSYLKDTMVIVMEPSGCGNALIHGGSREFWRSFPSLGILLVCMSLNGNASSFLWLLAAHSSTLALYLLLGSPVSTVLLAISIWYTDTSPGFALLTLDTQTIPVQSPLCLGGGGVSSNPSP